VRVAAMTYRRIAANVRGLPIVSHIPGVTTMRVRFLPLMLCLCVCGCATIQDYHYCCVQKYRADLAYKQNNGLWSRCSCDYRDGWKQGYYDLSTGQCEEPPATPPHKYWNPSYQSLEGKAAIDDWYSGWQDGATAAVQDGRPYFHPVIASPTAPVNQGPQCFQNTGPAADPHLESMPPAVPMATHDPQPQVHVGAVPRSFASQGLEDDELLDDSSLPVNRAAGFSPQGNDNGYFTAPPSGYEAADEAESQTDGESYE